jgi:hypothetical protein
MAESDWTFYPTTNPIRSSMSDRAEYPLEQQPVHWPAVEVVEYGYAAHSDFSQVIRYQDTNEERHQELVSNFRLGYQAARGRHPENNSGPPGCLCVEDAGMLFASALLKHVVRILLAPNKQLSQITLIGLGRQIPSMHPRPLRDG